MRAQVRRSSLMTAAGFSSMLTGMSIVDFEKPCEMLQTVVISPLRRYQTWPLKSCTSVTRKPTARTVPLMSSTVTMSPTPYWSSMIMQMPLKKSLTRLCAPKATAMPTTPAEAMAGITLMLIELSTVSTTTMMMSTSVIDLSTVPSVRARWAARFALMPSVVMS